jgi:hypothetical protein
MSDLFAAAWGLGLAVAFGAGYAKAGPRFGWMVLTAYFAGTIITLLWAGTQKRGG